MAMIEVENLCREFRMHKRYPGAFGAIRSLFTRQYEVKHAVKDVSFQIERGEAVGYVGPNGAGKSTTIKMLTGILVPTSGVVRVNGLVPYESRKPNARRIGVVFGQRSQLWWDLPVIDSFELHRHVYRMDEAAFRRNLDFYTELLDMKEFLKVPVRQLSLGQRMRGEIASALLHDPEVIYLDEPTIGLDVVVKDRIRQFIREVNQEKRVTVLLTTHDLGDIEQICPRIMIIDRGRVIYDGGVADLKERLGRHRTLVVEFEQEVNGVEVSTATLVREKGRRKWFRFDRSETTASRLLQELSARYGVHDLTVEEPTIEEIIREVYQTGAAQGADDGVGELDEIDTWSRGKAVV